MSKNVNLFLLSPFYINENNHYHVSYSQSYVIEQIFLRTCQAKIIFLRKNKQLGLFNKYRNRIFKSWFSISEFPRLSKGINVLLAHAFHPTHFLSIFSLGKILDQFELKLAYLTDNFEINQIDKEVLNNLDHIFVIVPEVADQINQLFPGKATFLPLGTDVLKYGSNNRHRCIEVTSYGRTNADVHNFLQFHFNQSIRNSFIYHHSTFDKPFVYNLEHHITLLYKLLGKSKISLCFEPSNVKRFNGRSIITSRWFEGLAAGCTIIGKKPFGPHVDELLDWENSTINIPENPSDWLPFFQEILADEETLMANSQRNYQQSLLRHDFRYRIQDMFKVLNLPLPSQILDDIKLLRERSKDIFTG